MIKGHGSCTITHLEKELREIDMLALPWLCALGCIRMGFTHPHKLNMKLIISGVPCNLLQKQPQDLLWIIIARSTSLEPSWTFLWRPQTFSPLWKPSGTPKEPLRDKPMQCCPKTASDSPSWESSKPPNYLTLPFVHHTYVSSDKCLTAFKLPLQSQIDHLSP